MNNCLTASYLTAFCYLFILFIYSFIFVLLALIEKDSNAEAFKSGGGPLEFLLLLLFFAFGVFSFFGVCITGRLSFK